MKSKTEWNQADMAKDLKLRHVVKVCRDGRIRNSLRTLTEEERLKRFWDRVKKDANGCWNWIGAVCGSGLRYGTFMHLGKMVKAHRYAYETFKNTKIPNGLIARHSCDNPVCVNPDHIEIGTAKDNSADMLRRGRHRFGLLSGEENGKSILTCEIARKIVSLWKEGLTQKEISATVGFKVTTVAAVLQGRTWSHATGIPKKT